MRIHEALAENKVDMVYSDTPRTVFVLARSLHAHISTWDACHIVGGFANEKISATNAKKLVADLHSLGRGMGSKYLIPNPDSYFLKKLFEAAGEEGWPWLNLL